MKNFRKYLKSANFGVLLLIGSVVVQGFHSFFVFADLSNFDPISKIISSAFYSIVLSFAILYYTMINKRIVALRFQIFESAVNLYYFFKGIIIMLVADKIGWLELIPRLVMAIGIAFILPYTIFEYASSVSIEDEEDDSNVSRYHRLKIKKEAEKALLNRIHSIEDIQTLNKELENDK